MDQNNGRSGKDNSDYHYDNKNDNRDDNTISKSAPIAESSKMLPYPELKPAKIRPELGEIGEERLSEKEVEEIERDIKKHQMKTNTKLSQIEQKKKKD